MKGNSQLEFVDSKIIPKNKGLEEKTLFDFFFLLIAVCLKKNQSHIFIVFKT